MASISWPSPFPDPISDDFNSEFPSGVIRTKMDSGPEKVRLRYTAVPERMKVSYWVSYDEYLVFRTFFLYTSKHGSLRFNYTHPLLHTTVEARFTDTPPGISDVTYEGKITIEVEIMP